MAECAGRSLIRAQYSDRWVDTERRESFWLVEHAVQADPPPGAAGHTPLIESPFHTRMAVGGSATAADQQRPQRRFPWPEERTPSFPAYAVRTARRAHGATCIAVWRIEQACASVARTPAPLPGGVDGALMVVWQDEVPPQRCVRPARGTHSNALLPRAEEDAVTFFAEPPFPLPGGLGCTLVIVFSLKSQPRARCPPCRCTTVSVVQQTGSGLPSIATSPKKMYRRSLCSVFAPKSTPFTPQRLVWLSSGQYAIRRQPKRIRRARAARQLADALGGEHITDRAAPLDVHALSAPHKSSLLLAVRFTRRAL